ncbi:MAG: sugar phosphate isomerase/epimerase [Balneolaceae bacterium]
MNIGVSLWLWTSPVTNEVIEKYAPKIARMGFDTIEIPLEDPGSLDAAAAAAVLKSEGLRATTCAAMGPGRDLVHSDSFVRNETMDYMKQSIEAASTLGSPVFVGPLYAEVGRLWRAESPEQRVREEELLVKQLSELSELGASSNVTLCVEALNRFETSFLNLTSQVAEITDRVNHPNCKILVDLFHAGIEEKNLGDAIRTAGERLGHIQVAENDRGTPGTGTYDWPGVAKALRDVGYKGDVVIETFSEDNEILAAAAAIWRPLAESPEKLAEDGLAFLRELLS